MATQLSHSKLSSKERSKYYACIAIANCTVQIRGKRTTYLWNTHMCVCVFFFALSRRAFKDMLKQFVLCIYLLILLFMLLILTWLVLQNKRLVKLPKWWWQQDHTCKVHVSETSVRAEITATLPVTSCEETESKLQLMRYLSSPASFRTEHR